LKSLPGRERADLRRRRRTEQFNDLLIRALSDHAALTAELLWRSAPSLSAGR
jgi:hypothetical protein